MKKSVTILGATGSIGLNALDIVRQHPDRFEIVGLTAHTKTAELAQLAVEFNAKWVAIGDEKSRGDLMERLANQNIASQNIAGRNIECLSGADGLEELASYPSDIVVSAIVGAAGLRPTLTAIRRGATIVLANKECLVCAGDLMHAEVEASGAKLLPADSEHNAIFQVFEDRHPDQVERLILTASGGPFLDRAMTDLINVSPAEAVAHPNWDMGAKISVDSATMMNKGLEMIEAYHLFPVERDDIDVLVHPQSIIHSMVEYIDGSILAQLGAPDMRTPLSYCMAWPDRIRTGADRLDFKALGSLTFIEPDYDKFRCLYLARQSLLAGGAQPAILNAANEIAVDAFLGEKIAFLDIAAIVETVLSKIDIKAPQSLSNVFEIDRVARECALQAVEKYSIS